MKERGKLASENLTRQSDNKLASRKVSGYGAVTDVQPDDIFPETNTYFNCVRAEGVEMFIGELSELFVRSNPVANHGKRLKDCHARYIIRRQLRSSNAGKDGSHE